MGLSVEYSSLVITHVIYKAAALILTVVRWVLCCALRYTHTYTGLFSSSLQSLLFDNEYDQFSSSDDAGHHNHSHSQQMIRDSLQVATYEDIAWRLPESSNTCAVCLNELRKREKVRELRNCSHVFHRRCIDKWVDHHDHYNTITCPLCRAPLLASPPLSTRTDLSWAVDRLLYLFGDDLL